MSLLSLRSAVGTRWRGIRGRITGSAIVLVYHRVADLVFDPQLLATSIEHFDEQIGLLARNYDVMNASELLDLMRHRRRIPRRTIVITMDDGYADALLSAQPILESHGVPATIFVSSDYIGAHREFWWDDVERIVFGCAELPDRIEIHVAGSSFVSSSSRDRGLLASDSGNAVRWDATMPPADVRQRLYAELLEFVLPLSVLARDQALASLYRQVGVEPCVRPTHRPLTGSELREIAARGVIEVGAHTKSHQVLAARPDSEQFEEIVGSKRAIEATTGQPVRSFAYPYGERYRYSKTSEAIARRAGFLGAFSAEFGIVVPWLNRFSVPRCPTENISGGDFLQRVEAWFEVGR